MSKQLLINELSLLIGTLFFIVSCFSSNFYLIALGMVMIIYSSTRIKKLKG